LDYIVQLGAKGVYIAGTPLKNLPWDSHYYNPYDFSVIDQHLGNLAAYRRMIDAAHAKGLYVMIDLTVNTAGNLLYFDGYRN
jgi:alpha-1,3-glucan synthase